MSFNAQMPLSLRRHDDDDYDDAPSPPAPSFKREIAKLVLTTFVTVATTKTVEHLYDRWRKKDETKV